MQLQDEGCSHVTPEASAVVAHERGSLFVLVDAPERAESRRVRIRPACTCSHQSCYRDQIRKCRTHTHARAHTHTRAGARHHQLMRRCMTGSLFLCRGNTSTLVIYRSVMNGRKEQETELSCTHLNQRLSKVNVRADRQRQAGEIWRDIKGFIQFTQMDFLSFFLFFFLPLVKYSHADISNYVF